MNVLIGIFELFGTVLLIFTGLIWWIAKRFGKELSPYKIFGVLDVILGIGMLTISIIEFVTPGGDLHGLLGTVLLLLYEPIVIVLLVVDLFLYKSSKKGEHQISEGTTMEG